MKRSSGSRGELVDSPKFRWTETIRVRIWVSVDMLAHVGLRSSGRKQNAWMWVSGRHDHRGRKWVTKCALNVADIFPGTCQGQHKLHYPLHLLMPPPLAFHRPLSPPPFTTSFWNTSRPMGTQAPHNTTHPIHLN